MNRRSFVKLLSGSAPRLLLIFLFATLQIVADEELPLHSSNGLGGGLWSDPRSWHDGTVPMAGSRVIISGADSILFDLATTTNHCSQLAIDPNGVLSFSMTGTTNLLRVAGKVEVYGTIRLDATREPESCAGIVLAAIEQENRTLTLLRGGAILLYGAKPSDETWQPNIVLRSDSANGPVHGTLTASREAMIDLQRVALSSIRIEANNLDNTGYKPGERINIHGCHFYNGAGVVLSYCDTAVIRDNRFWPSARSSSQTAVRMVRGSLGLCRGNLIDGYNLGISFAHEVDISIQGNQITDAKSIAILGEHSRNCMVKGNNISNAVAGVTFNSSNGVLEDLLLDSAEKHGASVSKGKMQFTNVTLVRLAEEALPLRLEEAAVTLLNVNLTPREITLQGNAPEGGIWVEMMNYLMVHLVGKRPSRATLQVATAAVSGGVPTAGAADLNVRNSPAPIDTAGWSPLPATMRPLIVRSWRMEATDKVVDAPFYDLALYGFKPDGTPDPKPLHKQVIEPADSWFRPEPNAAVATLEIKLP